MIRRLLWTLAVANKPRTAKTSQCSHRTCADPCHSKNVVSKQGRVHINETLRNGPPACRTACVGCGACRHCSTASSIGAAACSETHLNAVGSARDSQEAHGAGGNNAKAMQLDGRCALSLPQGGDSKPLKSGINRDTARLRRLGYQEQFSKQLWTTLTEDQSLFFLPCALNLHHR